jgi:hypothetical protein
LACCSAPAIALTNRGLFGIVKGIAKTLLSRLFLECFQGQLLCFQLSLTFLQIRSQLSRFFTPFFIRIVCDCIRRCTGSPVKSDAPGLNEHRRHGDCNGPSGGFVRIETLLNVRNVSFQFTYLLFLCFDFRL